jgi:hypothetical protein
MPTLRNRAPLLALATLSVVSFHAALSQAHFVLESPAAMTEQNGLGDPQKAPPCGDDGSASPTGERTSYVEGSTVSITINETIYHPGHYRVALALNDPDELPDPPPVTPGDSPCGSAPIDPNPTFPVLADGVLQHSSSFGGPQTFQVTLPEGVTCENCTLQIIEFMSDHGLNNPGGCYYHHCANIAITPAGGPGGGDAGAVGGHMDSGTSPSVDAGNTNPEPEPEPDPDPSNGGAADGGPEDSAPADSTSGGCSVARSDTRTGFALGLGLLALLARRTRRQRAS